MPQGSTFGPLIFSSIPTTLSDDKNLEFRLNKTYNRGAEWYLANELTLNEDKSEYICLYQQSKKVLHQGHAGGGGKGDLVTKSRWSFSDFTNHEEDNFIFTISLNTRC